VSPGAKEDDRLIRGRRKWLLAAASGAVLALGALAAPRDGTDAPPAAPAEPAAPLIEGAVAPREVFRGLRRLQEAGRTAARHTMQLQPSAVADRARSAVAAPVSLPAVAVRPRVLMAHLPAGAGRVMRFSVGGGAAQAMVERCDPRSGLALLTSEWDVPAAPLRARPFAVGDTGVAVAAGAGLLALDPVLVTGSGEGRLRLGLSRPVAGAPVFDADGSLAAIAGTEGEGWAVNVALARLDALAPAVPVLVGVALQALDDALEPARRAGGALIADVVPGSPAERAAVRPGLVLAAVGSRVVTSVAEAEAALGGLRPDAPVDLRLRDGARENVIQVVPEAACTAVNPSWPAAEGPLAISLFDPQALARAGVSPDAVVLSVDGAPPPRRVTGRTPRLVRVRVPGEAASFAVIRP
jgi:hypothetical protein